VCGCGEGRPEAEKRRAIMQSLGRERHETYSWGFWCYRDIDRPDWRDRRLVMTRRIEVQKIEVYILCSKDRHMRSSFSSFVSRVARGSLRSAFEWSCVDKKGRHALNLTDFGRKEHAVILDTFGPSLGTRSDLGNRTTSSDEEVRSGEGKMFTYHSAQLNVYPVRQGVVVCLT
jgi:hypothetical protein